MRAYIIHSSDKSDNYIDKVLATEKELKQKGYHIMNPLPDQNKHIGNEALNSIYGNLIPYCDIVYAMDGWDKPPSHTGDKEMAEAMKTRRTIMFEQV